MATAAQAEEVDTADIRVSVVIVALAAIVELLVTAAQADIADIQV